MTFNPKSYLCLDVETAGFKDEYGLQPWRAPTDAWLSSIAYQHGDQKKVILSPTKDDIRKMLSYALDNDLTLLAWNSTFDVAWLIAYGFDEEVHRLKHADGMLLHKHLHNSPGHTISHGLKATVKAYYPDEAGYEEDIEFFTTDADKLKQLAEYNLKDVEFTLRITEQIYNDLTPEQRNAAAIEAECIPLIAYANYAGLKVDVDAAQELKTKLEAKALALLQELSPDGVTEKIIRSPAQLNTLLFETWGLPKLKGDSTDKEALHELAHIDPRAKKLRELREALNLKTKFVEALIESADYNGDNTTHPQAIIFGTYSGRLTYSSTQGRGKDQRQTGFAIHQMKRDKEFRKLIKAPDGYTLVEFDAASQEYRLQAILSNDKQMLELCKGKDPHQYMADQIGEGTARQLGKVANLSLAYRTSAPKLKSVARVQYGIPMEIEEAKNIHAAYQQAYPGMVRYWDKQITHGKTKRSVDTLAGRRLHLDGDWNNDAWALGSSAINYPIQGTGADQKYLALSVLKPYLREINARFAFDLHDGIYLLIPTEKVTAAIEQIKLLLDNLPYEQAWGFTPAIPLPFDCKAGPSWGAMEEVALKSAGAGPDQETSPNLTALPAIVGGVTSERDLERSTDTNRPAAVITQVNFQPPNEQACELALDYARAGIRIFPCQSDKTPVQGLSWEDKATIDEDTIKRWFLTDYKSSARMVGMPCGVNGLVAIDPDVPKPEEKKYADGLAAFQTLASSLNIDLSNIPTVISPSGGRHYIFMQPEGIRLGNSTGNLPQGIDVRGAGGYVIAPGSIRYDGKAYAYAPNSPDLLDAINDAAVPAIPEALIEIIGRKSANQHSLDSERMPKHLLVEALLEHNIPNDKEFDGRDAWVEMAHAIYGASAGKDWGRREWLHWCGQRLQKPGEPERVWDTINPKNVRAGAGFIRQQLEDRGRDALYQKCKAAQAEAIFDKVEGQDDLIHVEDPDIPLDGVFFDGDAIPEPPPALIDDLIYANGINWIGGQSGAGKTFIAVDMAVALATGQPFLGREIKERVASIYIAAEGQSSISPRVQGAKLGRFIPNNLPIATIHAVPILNDQKAYGAFILKLKRVAAKLKETHNIRVGAVFIDTMAAAFQIKDENSAGEMQAVARTMEHIAKAVDAAAIAVHHYGKDAGTGLRGSSALRATGEAVLAVIKDVNEAGTVKRHVFLDKNRHGEEGAKFHFDIETNFVTVEGRDEPIKSAAVKLNEEGNRSDEQKLLDIINTDPEASIREMVEATKIKRSTVTRRLAKMVADGLIRKDGSKHFITPKGLEIVGNV